MCDTNVESWTRVHKMEGQVQLSLLSHVLGVGFMTQKRIMPD